MTLLNQQAFIAQPATDVSYLFPLLNNQSHFNLKLADEPL